jgi:DNA-binding NtrC family response regulator
VREADGGTLFLDEVAELPESSQVALLRALQERTIRPVGGSDNVAVDLRVVAATLAELDERVAEGSFRRDLFGRLAGVTVRLPPLRQRREDLGLLIGGLLHHHVGALASEVRFARSAARALLLHDWPLNVRELEHALRAAHTLAEGDVIEVEDLPDAVRQAQVRAAAPAAPDGPASADITLVGQLRDLLAAHDGNVSAVARDMGKAPMQIYRWLKRFGIDVDAYRS